MMALWAAWRNTSLSRTVGTRRLRIRSESRFPAPTLGSWSGSPTSTRRQSSRRAERSADIRVMSTIEVSSTMTASALKGLRSLWAKINWPVCSSNRVSSRRWMVVPSASHSSPIRLAARPVGAARAVFSPKLSNRERTPRREVVLPVPGPPVRRSTCREAASSTASFCWGAYFSPWAFSIFSISLSRCSGG